MNKNNCNFDKKIAQFIDNLKKEEYEKNNFIQERAKNTFKQLSYFLIQNRDNYMDLEDYHKKEYNLLFSLVYDYCEEINRYFLDEEIDFEHKKYWIKFENKIYEFFIMWGQSTHRSIKIIKKNKSTKLMSKLIIDFDDVMKYHENRL